MAANEVENLHPVFPWQHLTLSASLVCFSGCSIALWLISSLGPLQGDKSTFDMLDTAGHAHMRRHTHTQTHADTQTGSEMAYGRHAVPHLQMGKVETGGREKKLQTVNCGRILLSTWHPTDLILHSKATVLPLCMSLMHRFVSQETCGSYVGINIFPVLSEDIRS